ncbi:Aste57867_10314 [Aphanomyces stellatus]|uniref:Aste57867_10314 protein n=1 Tax=Aphanomyces stellatus TaxID=120398 RepID=A0A485KQP9_9STRA|nr:hypothetical protein As57867_010274 [Aphanomyces stellatus]VFT87188.1 Aste57867_10314 [Aphanomyces stellatus]
MTQHIYSHHVGLYPEYPPMMDTSSMASCCAGFDKSAATTTPTDDDDDLHPVHIEAFHCFDANLLEPIPFHVDGASHSAMHFGGESGFDFAVVLTLESAHDYFVDTWASDVSTTLPIKAEPLDNDATSSLYLSDEMKSELTVLALPTIEVPGQCFQDDCTKTINYRGYCKDHGGVRLCSVVGCMKGNQGKRLCISHGGGKRCRVHDCEKSAQSHGLCKAHGGGARCTIANCDKSSQGGGLCRKHGGGRRCSVPDCTSGAQRANLCAKHGGSRLCSEANCGRTDRGGGLCENHRKNLVCLEPGCNRLAIQESIGGLCLRHTRRRH